MALLTSTRAGHAANIFWTGPTNTFTHAADTTTADELTTNHVGADAVNNVWLTRGAAQPLYNAAAESSWNGSTSPVNTMWVLASGSLTNAASLTYNTFDNVVGQPGNSPGRSVGKTFFVKIVSDNIYLQLKLTAWGNNNGGSFQYQRTTPAVAPPPTPTISITNPVNGASFAAPANVGIGASALVSSGTITNVQFFTNGSSLKSINAAPFTFTANNLAAGAYLLTAVATAGGISATSTPVNFSVLAVPTVTLTNPPNGTVFAAPANIKLGASAAAGSGPVTNVQFLANNTNLLGSATVAPFKANSGILAAGPYTLTAVATAAGISATSAPVNVSVVNPVPVSLSGGTVSTGGFSFTYTANPGLSYVVQSSSNLMAWLSLATNTVLASPVSFSNPATNHAQFYRIGLLPNP